MTCFEFCKGLNCIFSFYMVAYSECSFRLWLSRVTIDRLCYFCEHLRIFVCCWVDKIIENWLKNKATMGPDFARHPKVASNVTKWKEQEVAGEESMDCCGTDPIRVKTPSSAPEPSSHFLIRVIFFFFSKTYKVLNNFSWNTPFYSIQKQTAIPRSLM